MTKTDGEQELVLGNKQLLSAFFIVVVLLGVFFTMGYIVGRNTGSLTPKTDAGVTAAPPVFRPDPTVNTPSARPNSPVETAPKELDPVATGPAPATRPARADDQGAVAAAAPGSLYLQVAALKRPEAEMEVKILRDHTFPALLGESPKEGLFRVLVGPFKDMQSLARTKSDLKSAGFDSFVQK